MTLMGRPGLVLDAAFSSMSQALDLHGILNRMPQFEFSVFSEDYTTMIEGSHLDRTF